MDTIKEENLETVSGGKGKLENMAGYALVQGEKVLEVLKDIAADAADINKQM